MEERWQVLGQLLLLAVKHANQEMVDDIFVRGLTTGLIKFCRVVDLNQGLKVLDLFLLLFTFLSFDWLGDVVAPEYHQLGFEVLLADLSELLGNDLHGAVAATLRLLLVLRSLLLVASTVISISSSLRVSGVFVVIRLLLILAASGLVLRLALITSTSVILVAALGLVVGSVQLIKLSLLNLGFGLDLDLLVLLPALGFIVEHILDQKLESLADFPPARIIFHGFKARVDSVLFVLIGGSLATIYSLLEDLAYFKNKLEGGFDHVISWGLGFLVHCQKCLQDLENDNFREKV